MTAHAASATPAAPIQMRHAPRLRPRMVLMLLVMAVAAGAFAWPVQVAAAARATCTIGAPSGATCGEALWLLGYP